MPNNDVVPGGSLSPSWFIGTYDHHITPGLAPLRQQHPPHLIAGVPIQCKELAILSADTDEVPPVRLEQRRRCADVEVLAPVRFDHAGHPQDLASVEAHRHDGVRERAVRHALGILEHDVRVTGSDVDRPSVDIDRGRGPHRDSPTLLRVVVVGERPP